MNTQTKTPVLFIGHGSPLLAIEKDGLASALNGMSEFIRPKAILAISAHWETSGVKIQASKALRTIHDFYGFHELEGLVYPAQGDSVLAAQVKRLIPEASIVSNWGLDHGVWTVLTHLFPNADIPIVPLSLNKQFSPADHLALAEKLRPLREQGVLLFCSGNIVHNLRAMDRSGEVYAWAKDFEKIIMEYLHSHNLEALADYEKLGCKAELSAPTPEHFLPLLYAVGASEPKEKIKTIYEGFQLGSISQRSLLFG